MGEQNIPEERKSGILLSGELDVAIEEFRCYCKTKINQSKQLNGVSRPVAMLVLELGLFFLRVVGWSSRLLRN